MEFILCRKGRVSEVASDDGIVLALHINTEILLGIRMVVKSAYSVLHICLSAHVIVAPTGQISMKFDLQNWLKSYKYIGHFQ